MTEELLKQVVVELAEIRRLLTAVIKQQTVSQDLSDTKAEIAMVEAMNLDPVQYLKDRCRKHRGIKHKSPATSRKQPAGKQC